MAAQPPITAVLFDLDDTLLDSLAARTHALQRVFNTAGIKSVSAADFLANLPGISFDAALHRLGITEKTRDDLFIIYRRAYWLEPRSLRLFPGVRDMLESLKDRGFTLGVVTSKARNTEFEGTTIGCLGEMNEMGIAGFFKTVVGFEDVKQTKPHPEGVLLALDDLKINPGETMLVGDSSVDVAAAKAAGCVNCLAAWGLPGKKPPEGLETDFVAFTPADVVSIVSGEY
jgi:pyrophosphatase PpaX